MIVVGNHQNAIHNRHAHQRDEADCRRDAEIQAREIKRQHATADREWYPGERQETVAQRIEQTVEQNHDQQQADRNDHFKALFCPLQVFELAGPDDAVAYRQLHILGDALLRFGNRAAKIAVADAELHRNVALS